MDGRAADSDGQVLGAGEAEGIPTRDHRRPGEVLAEAVSARSMQSEYRVGHTKNILPKAFPRTVWDWTTASACTDAPDPTIFFPEDRHNVKTRQGLADYLLEVEGVALAFCAHCPVSEECYDHGLEKREPAGIWGGIGPYERERIRKQK